MISVGHFWYEVMRKLSRRECNNQTDQLDNPVVMQYVILKPLCYPANLR
jgi:hypothetical protein